MTQQLHPTKDRMDAIWNEMLTWPTPHLMSFATKIFQAAMHAAGTTAIDAASEDPVAGEMIYAVAARGSMIDMLQRAITNAMSARGESRVIQAGAVETPFTKAASEPSGEYFVLCMDMLGSNTMAWIAGPGKTFPTSFIERAERFTAAEIDDDPRLNDGSDRIAIPAECVWAASARVVPNRVEIVGRLIAKARPLAPRTKLPEAT